VTLQEYQLSAHLWVYNHRSMADKHSSTLRWESKPVILI